MASGKFTFDEDAFEINVVDPTLGFTGVELYSDSAEYAATPGFQMSHIQPVLAAGKFPLGAGVLSDSIFSVQEPWKIKPYGGTYRLVVEGTVITDGAIEIDYNTQTVAFTIGDYVVGGTSDATGIILADTTPGVGDGTLTIGHVTGTFVDGETLTDDSAGSADASSSPTDVVTSPFANADSGTVTIIVIAASSGTVAFSEEINNQSFLGQVWIDTDRGNPGTTFPRGTPTDPVDNFTDALAIATLRKLNAYHLEDTLTLTTEDISDTDWRGNSPTQSRLELGSGSTNTNDYLNMTVFGALSGTGTFTRVHFDTVTGWQGQADRCVLENSITMDGSATGEHAIIASASGVSGASTPFFDKNSNSSNVSFRAYTGGIEIRNMTAGNMSIDMVSGHIILAASCTGGTIVVRGIAKLTDNSAGSTIDSDGLVDNVEIRKAQYNDQILIDTVNGTAGTTYPIGTPNTPVSNITDALTIATNLNVTTLSLRNSFITLTASENVDGMLIQTEGAGENVVVMSPASPPSTSKTTFMNVIVGGTAGGTITIIGGVVGVPTLAPDLIVTDGLIRDALLVGDSVQFTDVVRGAALLRCHRAVEDNVALDVDFGGNALGQVIDCQGNFNFINATDALITRVISLQSGQITLDSTITEGIVELEGLAFLVDNSGPNVDPNTDRLVSTITSVAVWDELLTGNTHNINNSAGKQLRTLSSQVVHTDTAQGPAVNGNQIQLALAAESFDGAYDPSLIAIIDGTGVGQSRNILEYEGSTRIATVDRNWKVNPDNTSEYVIYANAGREHVNEGLAQGGSNSTMTLNSLASGVNDIYVNQTLFLRSGTGEDQVKVIIAYNGTTKVATIDGVWATNPDSTTGYVMLPNHDIVKNEQLAAYNNVVLIDTSDGSAGTLYPSGTGLSPVNNLADAKTIAASFGLKTFRVVGTLVIGAAENVDGLVFEGSNPLTETMVLTAGCSTEETSFSNMIVAGTGSGATFFVRCGLSGLSGIGSDVSPVVFDTCFMIESTFTLATGLTTPQNIQLIDCIAGIAAGAGTIWDLNGTDSPVAFRNYRGAITIANGTDATQNLEFGSTEGKITFASSCTAGTALVKGVVMVTDNSTDGYSVDLDPVIETTTLRASGEPYGSGTVVAPVSATLSSTSITTDLGSPLANHWTDGFVRFTSGALAGQVKLITAYAVSESVLTTEAFTSTPGVGDTFIIINS